MQKLKSFDQFSTETKISQTRQVEEDKTIKRQNEAETFKTLLAEFNVTSIKELTQEQRVTFFTKLRGAEVNESVSLIEEGTRGQIGKIDKKGNITSVYMQYDSYPENILPHLNKGFKNGKNVDELIKKGSFSGLEASIDKISFYGTPGHMTGSAATAADIKKYLTKTSNEESAEYVYLWDENAKQWMMADTYANTGLVPAFESLSVSVNEAIQVQYKRDAKKVLTVYNNLFGKKLTDFGAMNIDSKLGCIKYLLENAMTDANFHKEGPVASAAIKGNIGTFQVKMAGLGNYFIKIGATTVKRILDQYVTDISGAAGWSGVGIAEGTALYLEQIGQEAAGQSMLNAFNGMFNESFINEAEKFKSTKDFEEFCEEIDGMPESRIKKIMGKDYIDTPGGYRDEAEDYDNDITEYMISNMGRKEFEKLQDWWESNVAESVVTEAEIKSDEEFSEYAMTVLKKAFGAEFDEAKAKKVADGILAKSKGDYGTAVGMLTSSLGESVTNEAKEFSFAFNYNTDEDDVAYIQNVLKKAGVNATAEAGLDSEEMEVKAANAIELRKAKKAIEADGFQINEAIDTKYWADYNTDTSGQGNKEFAEKSKDFEDTFSLAVAEWNDEADGAENRIIGSQVDKVKKIAQQFFKKEGYISVNIAQAMIAQEA